MINLLVREITRHLVIETLFILHVCNVLQVNGTMESFNLKMITLALTGKGLWKTVANVSRKSCIEYLFNILLHP